MNAIIFYIFFLIAYLFGFCPSEIDQLTPEQQKIICEIVDADDGGA
jgi:hypothetical protein